MFMCVCWFKTRLQQAITTAKKKIKQYQIPEHTNAGMALVSIVVYTFVMRIIVQSFCYLSQRTLFSTNLSGEETILDDLQSPVVQLPIQNASCVKDTPIGRRELNKTCMALFESPSVDQVDHFKLARNRTVESEHLTNLPGTSLVLERGESVETTAESCDVVVIDADQPVNVGHTHQSDGGECDSEEESSCEFTVMSQLVTMQSEEMTSESEEHSKHSNEHSNDSDHSNNDSDDDHCDSPIHLIYSHAHDCGGSHGSPLAGDPEQPLASPNKLHTSVSTGRSLIRREVRGKFRYKVIEKPLHQPSSTVTRSADLADDDGGAGSMSSLSQEDSFESDLGSNSSSPSFLNASSQWKVCPPSDHDTHSPPLHTNQHDVMTCSLFPSTPLTSVGNSIAVTTPATTGQVIPKSDSQLSLDISQSIPFSPELKDPFMKPTIPAVAATDCQDDSCIEISGPMSPEAVKEKNPVSKQLSLGRRKIPNNRVVIREEKSPFDVSASPGDKLTPNLLPRNVVLATPGVKPVNNILQKTNGWMAIQPHTHIHPANTLNAKTISGQPRLKHHSSQEDIEEMFPSKKLRLAADRNKQSETKREERTSLLSVLQSMHHNDETRLMDGLEDINTPAWSEYNVAGGPNTSHEVLESTNHHQHK